MHRSFLRSFLLAGSLLVSQLSAAQHHWEAASYPDEAGFRARTQNTLALIAGQGFARKSMAPSTCPDTGLPVHSWALEGEEITSPYTGTRYKQGPVGYFGPTTRDEQGRIEYFGGDPLKYDLPPATATLLLNPGDEKARQYLHILGNMNQQYHFAAVNWTRFYPLLARHMSPKWNRDFVAEVGKYTEFGKNVKGTPKGDPRKANNLIGQPHEFLGGGGTENHKTMWRTSALLYAQLLPAGSQVSGYPLAEAETITAGYLRDYLQKAFRVGNGEYDSNIYYPYSINGFLNLYDFSPRPATKRLAQAALDFYVATYGLKMLDGTIAGAQKRGYFTQADKLNGMEELMWAWTGATSRPVEAGRQLTTLHQATSGYRPNQVICNIITKKVALPFQAQIARPAYHMDQGNVYQESFYCAPTFALGNVAMSRVDNPNQQTVWSLVAAGTQGPLQLGGGQPARLNPAGHSPYTQTVHHQGALLLMSGQTAPKPAGGLTEEQKQRYAHAADRLSLLAVPKKWTLPLLEDFYQQAPKMAASWLYIPRQLTRIKEEKGVIYLEANNTFVAVTPLQKNYFWLRPDLEAVPRESKSPLSLLRQYQVLVVPGHLSGYSIDTGERQAYPDLAAFIRAVQQKTELDKSRLKQNTMAYTSLAGDKISMTYQPAGLRASGQINGKEIDYAHWANGGVYDSPYVKIKDGVLQITDGSKGYRIDYRGAEPVFENL